MPYAFETEDRDYSDFAGGRVIYSLPGAPAFPARLASEIFLRGQKIAAKSAPLRLFDPCCGGAYHLAAVGFLHGAAVEHILAADIDRRALELAEKNLGLLTQAGLRRREEELRALLAEYGKESHAVALKSAQVLRQHLPGGGIPSRVFQANALDRTALQVGMGDARIDLVICDVPYGMLTGWVLPDETPGPAPLWRLLDSLAGIIDGSAVVAIASDKAQKPAHEGYRRVEKFQVGKRLVTFLRKA